MLSSRERAQMSVEIKIAILITAGAGLAFLTRRSLKGLHTHGLYRLIAWIAAIALILVNCEIWFVNPMAKHQVLSWVLLLLSVVTVIYGFFSLRKGRPGGARGDLSLIGVERTTELVEAGAYRYIRHPMYSSLLTGSLGVFLKDASWLGAILTGIVILSTVLASKSEERENLQYFGKAYREYMERTRMFIPFLL
jgi:protein-S-isoprenylcysteine O-methyltransferase Ste14